LTVKKRAISFVVVMSAIIAVGLLSAYAPSQSSALGIRPLVAPAAAAPAAVNVTIPNGAGLPAGAPGYAPDAITVVIGVNNTVNFVNMDQGASHTVTCMTASTCPATFDSGNMVKSPSSGTPGGVFTYTFTVPGTYKYLCTYHSWMTGSVTVLAATSSASATSTTTATTPEFPASAVAAVLLVAIVAMVLALRVYPLRSRGSGSA
jgi:plastocyanin